MEFAGPPVLDDPSSSDSDSSFLANVPCEKDVVQNVIGTAAGKLGIDFSSFGFSFDHVSYAGADGSTQTELFLSNANGSAYDNLIASSAFLSNFANGGSDPMHGAYNQGNWRQTVAANSIQITADGRGNIQVDIDPHNSMLDFLGHTVDVIMNTLSGGGHHYHSVASALGIDAKNCP